jgi:F-box protein 9
VAVHDVAEFTRMSLVCRRFAYLVSSEQRIWRRISLGHKFGFAAMHHHFAVAVDWSSLDDHIEELPDGTVVSARDLQVRRAAESSLVTRSLVPSTYPTWKALFRQRPRVRFNGCYISTVNYLRAGQMSTNQATWGGSLVHIVTYYRYLRFFRDGSVISLLTTHEPSEIVHHLTKEELLYHRRDRDRSHHQHQHHADGQSILPSAAMSLALKGRWRLSSTLDAPDGDDDEANPPQEGDLCIETEGVAPRYMYRMDLTMRSAGRAARNNKLVWRGFYSYNKLTDDWGTFMLKNDKPFFFSRVKSYGFGE